MSLEWGKEINYEICVNYFENPWILASPKALEWGEKFFIRNLVDFFRNATLVSIRRQKGTNRIIKKGGKARVTKLDGIIQRLYEDNIEGKVSDERFAKLTATYEAEQRQLEHRIAELQSFMANTKNESLGVDTFLSMVRRYTDIKELDAEIIRVFVEKILVYKAEKVDGHRVQRIKIIYNGIGEIPTTPVNEKTA